MPSWKCRIYGAWIAWGVMWKILIFFGPKKETFMDVGVVKASDCFRDLEGEVEKSHRRPVPDTGEEPCREVERWSW